MRICFVSHSFAPLEAPLSNVGGMQRVAMELAEALARRSDVALTLDVLRAPWSRIAVKAPIFLSGLPARLVRRAGELDVVLFSSITSAAAALPAFPALRRAGVRIAAIAHGLDVTHPNPAYRLAVTSTLPRLDVVLPVSSATALECEKRGARSVVVVPNGIDAARFDRAPVVGRAPIVPDDAFVVLAVGRQVRRKGFGWFVAEVMPRLVGNVRLVLVGDGPERETIEHLAEESGVSDRVCFAGRVGEDELAALFRRADVFVMPNVPVPGDMEGFGIVLLEAGICGVPAVAAAIEGMRDVIVHGVTGELVPSGDAAAFAEAIDRLRWEPERATRYGEQARAHLLATYGWPAIASRYLDAIGGRKVASVEAASAL